MKKRDPIVLDYGFPNICKPLIFNHIRSFIVGDSFRRILNAGNCSVIADLHSNDLGKQIGFLLYHIKNYQKNATHFSSIAGIHRAFFSIKKMSQGNLKIQKETLDELISCQENPNYMKKERDSIYQIFLDYIKNFMRDFNVSVDLFGKESDYIETLKKLVDHLLEFNLASVIEGAVVMKASPNFKETPLMIRHQDGRYLYSGIDLSGVLYRSNHLKARKILYIISSGQNTQISQIFDAALQLNINSCLVHVRLGDLFAEGESTPKNPAKFLEKLALIPCSEIIFPDHTHKKSFLYSAFKLHNMWHKIQYKVVVNFDSFQEEESYIFLKKFGLYRKKYHHLINEYFESGEIKALLEKVESTDSLLPVIQALKKHMNHIDQGFDIRNSINSLSKILSILGLDTWEITSLNFNYNPNKG